MQFIQLSSPLGLTLLEANRVAPYKGLYLYGFLEKASKELCSHAMVCSWSLGPQKELRVEHSKQSHGEQFLLLAELDFSMPN